MTNLRQADLKSLVAYSSVAHKNVGLGLWPLVPAAGALVRQLGSCK